MQNTIAFGCCRCLDPDHKTNNKSQKMINLASLNDTNFADQITEVKKQVPVSFYLVDLLVKR